MASHLFHYTCTCILILKMLFFFFYLFVLLQKPDDISMTTIIAAIVSQRMSICWNHSCTVLNKFVSNTHIANCEETSFGMGDTYLIRTSDKFTLTLVWIVERSNPRIILYFVTSDVHNSQRTLMKVRLASVRVFREACLKYRGFAMSSRILTY